MLIDLMQFLKRFQDLQKTLLSPIFKNISLILFIEINEDKYLRVAKLTTLLIQK